MRPQLARYQTPPGKVDFPFAYIYDASGLTDGLTYRDIQVPLQGDSDFILRHIAGVNLCVNTAVNGGRFNFKNSNRQYVIGAAQGGIVFPPNWPVLPEILYPYNSSIYIDLFTVLRNFTACGNTPIYNSQIAFFGVKRFDQAAFPQYQTKYKYRTLPQTYSVTGTINWAHFDATGAPQAAVRASQLMDRYDFELYAAGISQPGAVTPLLTNDFQVMLWDAFNHQCFSAPINQAFGNAARTTAALAPQYQGLFPVPPLLYPAGSQIVVDTTSMLCAASLPQTYNLALMGVWRIPL